MSRIGLDWYKREPVALLADTQGLTAKEHAVYNVIIDLLYIHGGSIRNDPAFIAGWIADMGAASVRRTIASLDTKSHITLTISEDEISQKRAKNEAKTKQKLTENRRKTGEKGGKKSAELRAVSKKNNDLGEASASNEIQPEKRREEKSNKEEAKASKKKRACGIPENAVISDKQIEFATKNFLSLQEAEAQFDKFKNSAIANGRKYANWDRAFLSWITSEYFKPITGGTQNGQASINGRGNPNQAGKVAGLDEARQRALDIAASRRKRRDGNHGA